MALRQQGATAVAPLTRAMRTIRTTRRLSQGKQPLHAHLHRRRVYGTSASPGGALHTPEGDLATIGLLNKLPHEESPSRQWTGWRTNMLPRSSMRLPLDSCSDAAADAIEASAHRSHPRAFDLVVSGGGLAAFYGGAVSSVLATLARRGVLEVGLLHGVSSGALVCATFLGCEAGFTKLSDMYRCLDIFMGWHEGRQERRRPWLSYGMRQFLDEALPPDIHERATGRMHVTVSEVLATQEGKVSGVSRGRSGGRGRVRCSCCLLLARRARRIATPAPAPAPRRAVTSGRASASCPTSPPATPF